jgi:predicted ABC-type ATPase
MNPIPADPALAGQRRAIIVAGPNGSGKSTLIRQLRADPAFGFPDRYINADDIASELASRLVGASQQGRERAAFHRARDLRREFREQGVSHAFETVLSHPSTLLDMRRLRDAGFLVTLVFVTTSNPAINIGRVAARVRAGGHDVPRDKIVDRYERAMGFLPHAVEEADRAFVFDAAGRTRLVALIENGVLHAEGGPLPVYLTH